MYLKTSIIEAKVDNIRCMDHECDEIITDEFKVKFSQHPFQKNNFKAYF